MQTDDIDFVEVLYVVCEEERLDVVDNGACVNVLVM